MRDHRRHSFQRHLFAAAAIAELLDVVKVLDELVFLMNYFITRLRGPPQPPTERIYYRVVIVDYTL